MNRFRQGYVAVSNGNSNGRTFGQPIVDGKITITGSNRFGDFKRTVTIKDGELHETKLKASGYPVYHIVYGQFEKLGATIVRFKKGTGKGKHGKARRYEELFGQKGTCHSWYKNGRLIRQKFIWFNRKKAYDYNAYTSECVINDWNGNILYEVKGHLSGKLNNAMHEGHSVFDKSIYDWFTEDLPFEVKEKGKIIFKGEYKHRQKVGMWVEEGVTSYYQNGVAIPEKLFNTPVDKLDPLKILKIKNAQLRMALMSKIDPKKIANCGKVIHKDGDMRLYSIKDFDVKILRVRCNTTNAYYYLKVPKDSKECEQARQWTFGVGEYIRKPIKFEVET